MPNGGHQIKEALNTQIVDTIQLVLRLKVTVVIIDAVPLNALQHVVYTKRQIAK
jgi:hypothetical protein